MEKQIEILEKIVRADAVPAKNWSKLLSVYARSLAAVADKLTEEELAPLIAVGALMHREWKAEMDANPDIQELIRADEERRKKA